MRRNNANSLGDYACHFLNVHLTLPPSFVHWRTDYFTKQLPMCDTPTEKLDEIASGPDEIKVFVAKEALRYDDPSDFFADLSQH